MSECLKLEQGLGELGIGTDILALALIRRAIHMHILSQKNFWLSGIGQSILLHSRKSLAIYNT